MNEPTRLLACLLSMTNGNRKFASGIGTTMVIRDNVIFRLRIARNEKRCAKREVCSYTDCILVNGESVSKEIFTSCRPGRRLGFEMQQLFRNCCHRSQYCFIVCYRTNIMGKQDC